VPIQFVPIQFVHEPSGLEYGFEAGSRIFFPDSKTDL
jgi:hypothetical protein